MEGFMPTHRTTARVVGVLFIIATAAAIIRGTLLLESQPEKEPVSG